MNIKKLLSGVYLKDSEEYISNLSSFAKSELERLEVSTPDAIILPFKPEILALCEAFGRSGQSGGSAPYTSGALSMAIKHLTMFMPLAPLTGEDSEWVNVSDFCGGEVVFQNNRLSSVFKEGDEKPYYLDAIIWKGLERHDTFTGHVYLDDTFQELISSSQCVDFPFTAKSFTVDVDYLPIDKEVAEEDCIHYIENSDGSCYVSVIKNPKDLEEVWKYYKKKVHK